MSGVDDGERRYVAIGDSFTAGAPDEADPWTWADGLARLLTVDGSAWRFHRLAKPNTESVAVVEHQLDQACARAPSLVTLTCGGADVLNAFSLEPERHAEALDVIFARLTAAAPDALIMAMTYPDLSHHLPYRSRSKARAIAGIAAVNDNIRRFAADYGVSCVDLFDTAADRDAVGPDGVHLSSAGHTRVLAIAAAAIAAARPDLLDPNSVTTHAA